MWPSRPRGLSGAKHNTLGHETGWASAGTVGRGTAPNLGVELTAASVRSCLAPASSRSSRVAFGVSSKHYEEESRMSYYTQKLNRWLLPMVAVGVMLSVLLPARSPALAGMVGTLVTTDYFVSHTSIEPSYTQYHLVLQL